MKSGSYLAAFQMISSPGIRCCSKHSSGKWRHYNQESRRLPCSRQEPLGNSGRCRLQRNMSYLTIILIGLWNIVYLYSPTEKWSSNWDHKVNSCQSIEFWRRFENLRNIFLKSMNFWLRLNWDFWFVDIVTLPTPFVNNLQ